MQFLVVQPLDFWSCQSGCHLAAIMATLIQITELVRLSPGSHNPVVEFFYLVLSQSPKRTQVLSTPQNGGPIVAVVNRLINKEIGSSSLSLFLVLFLYHICRAKILLVTTRQIGLNCKHNWEMARWLTRLERTMFSFSLPINANLVTILMVLQIGTKRGKTMKNYASFKKLPDYHLCSIVAKTTFLHIWCQIKEKMKASWKFPFFVI